MKAEQLQQALDMYNTQLEITAEVERDKLEAELMTVLDAHLSDRVKIILSGRWMTIGDGVEEDIDEQ